MSLNHSSALLFVVHVNLWEFPAGLRVTNFEEFRGFSSACLIPYKPTPHRSSLAQKTRLKPFSVSGVLSAICYPYGKDAMYQFTYSEVASDLWSVVLWKSITWVRGCWPEVGRSWKSPIRYPRRKNMFQSREHRTAPAFHIFKMCRLPPMRPPIPPSPTVYQLESRSRTVFENRNSNKFYQTMIYMIRVYRFWH
jgi:hypothetical protein